MNYAAIIAFLLSLPGAVRMPVQVVRDVVLQSEAQTHSIAVRGWPGIITAVRLPDSFALENVLCADCFDPEAQGAKTIGDDSDAGERNWILERRPKEHTLFLRPARLPSLDNPVAGFATNIVVTLDGGTLINLEVSLATSSLKSGIGSEHDFQSDAVVTLRYPDRKTLSGRLAEEKKHLEEQSSKRFIEAKQQWLATFLTGEIRCHNLALGATTRSQNVSLRVTNICSSSAKSFRSYWVKYRIENRGLTPVRFLGDSLAVDAGEPTAAHVSAPQDAARATLNFGETYDGVALLERVEKRGLQLRLSLSTMLEGEEAVHLRVGGLKP